MKLKMIICGVVCGIVITACGKHDLTSDESLRAETGARDFAERATGKFISCSGEDSDRDGYVTCTIEVNKTMQDIACAYKTRGCKKK